MKKKKENKKKKINVPRLGCLRIVLGQMGQMEVSGIPFEFALRENVFVRISITITIYYNNFFTIKFFHREHDHQMYSSPKCTQAFTVT